MSKKIKLFLSQDVVCLFVTYFTFIYFEIKMYKNKSAKNGPLLVGLAIGSTILNALIECTIDINRGKCSPQKRLAQPATDVTVLLSNFVRLSRF